MRPTVVILLAVSVGLFRIAVNQAPEYRQQIEAWASDALGYPVYDEAQVVGHLERFHEDLVVALNVVDALVSSPADLAWLLDAAGGLALDHAGKIALERALPDF